jgi:3-isopropylmalate/(R)-2-methylmalate dehydratase small subunit
MCATRGKAFVVGDNIDTDQIIPAEFLSYNPADPDERKYFGRYAMNGVPEEESGLPQGNVRFVPDGEFTTEYAVVIAGRNFGCGSSREHAPLAIAEAGCTMVVAESFARIFYRNSVNGGYLTPLEADESIEGGFSTGDEVEVDPHGIQITNVTTGKTYAIKPLGDVGPIVAAGGIFEYAKETGMLDSSVD